MNEELTERIVSYEQGKLDANQIVSLFQELIDTGIAWNLQGHCLVHSQRIGNFPRFLLF